MLMFSSKDEENIETREKYGFLFEDLDNKTQYQMMYQAIFMIRRAFFAILVVFLVAFPILQIQLHILSTFVYIWYIIKVQPFKDKYSNYQEIFNEVVGTIVSSYCYKLFLNMSLSSEQR